MGMSRPIADMLGDISAEALFDMKQRRLAMRIAGSQTVVARRLESCSIWRPPQISVISNRLRTATLIARKFAVFWL